ncbi:zinc finger BED domain-containing protein RICESLEEPER 2 [Tanacetum coccineum]
MILLTAELERYKEQVKVLKEGQNVDLKSQDNVLDSCAQSVEIDHLKRTLSEHLKEKESLLQTVTLLKNDFKKEESRNLDREIALEKHIKHLDNIKAQQLEPMLYVGDIIQKTNPIMILDSEETLTLIEESRSKMLLKHKDNMMQEKIKQIDTTPIDYVALNKLYKDFETRFVPQTELSDEQAFWSHNSMSSSEPDLSDRPTNVEVPKELPKNIYSSCWQVITCAAALNPCFNVSGVELLIESTTTDLECFDDGFATKAKERFNQSLEGLYNIYYLKYENSNKRARNDRLASSEYERYVTSDFVSHISTVLGFWKASESTFPILSRMALDILSVQGTLVASESAFLTSGRVLSIRRTRLISASLEMCMCLKDHLDVTDRIQHTSNLENTLDFEEEILDEEVLENEAIALFDVEIALDEAASEARSGGE